MTMKYKVTQMFMDKLIDWRSRKNIDATNGDRTSYLGQGDLVLPYPIINWWLDDKNPIERNNRLIAIIQWLNGEDVFEVDKPHKFVVRNDTPDEDGDYYYVQNYNGMTERVFSSYGATQFDTREEAQEWANSHQVIVEIDENGNEVED